ncbi:hypothetical protein PE067_08745 [Paracoccus sp. DMF-8]|uniref:hypothetical protein n=1 Tax=Paracoccus sp. DMF-8 TaxID=3019445 RepID=UPI0023E7D712|nr:hypothetical protein [Paracoccus sp. DMF-8]MDF3606211.1 hypothetical protein [Paracoccus sp. DMF-8]
MSGKFYYTGRSPRALWQRFRMWRAYRRPVTFYDLRKITHDVVYRDGDYHRPDRAAEAVFMQVIHQAERPVWGKS